MMQRWFFLLMALCGAILSFAQEGTASLREDWLPLGSEEIRLPRRIENTTDYSSPVVSRHRRVGIKETAPIPSLGSPKIPVVLVQFSDLNFTVAEGDEAVKESFQKYCNGTGVPGEMYRPPTGSWGSVSDYFIEQSDSLFQPQFEVIGPITLSKPHAFYGEDLFEEVEPEGGNGEEQEGEKEKKLKQKDWNIKAFYSEACQLAIQNYDLDWSDFDNNHDGKVDFVFFIYAGSGQNEVDDSDLIWPKESSSTLTVEVDETTTILFGAYGCACELFQGKEAGVGIMCHELSHGLGLPDLYDTVYENFGMDLWDLMDYGCYQISSRQPCGYSAYERDFMGWRPLQRISKGECLSLTLEPIERGGVGYIVTNDGQASGDEYFILENRQNIGFDTYLGCPSFSIANKYGVCHGLLITHVDYLASAWSKNRVNTVANHQRLTLVPADGTLISSIPGFNEEFHLSLRGDIYPGSEEVTELSSYDVFVGRFTQRISNIVEHEDGTVTLDINGGATSGPGDVDRDGLINISDVTQLVNIILGRSADTWDNGDANADDKVDISDVTTVVNRILNKE